MNSIDKEIITLKEEIASIDDQLVKYNGTDWEWQSRCHTAKKCKNIRLAELLKIKKSEDKKMAWRERQLIEDYRRSEIKEAKALRAAKHNETIQLSIDAKRKEIEDRERIDRDRNRQWIKLLNRSIKEIYGDQGYADIVERAQSYQPPRPTS